MEPRATVNFALESIRRGDLTSAIDRVESDGEAEQVSADHAQLIKILYAQDKDVTNMAAVGKAAVRYHLRRSELERNVAATLKLKTAAKRLACNVAANCWPAGAMRAWSSRPRISMRGLSSRSCRCDWSRNWRSAPISSATTIGSSARFSSPPEEPMPLCCRSDRRATPSRQLQVLLADGYRAIAYRQAPDRADRSARDGCSDRRAYSRWFEAGEGGRRPAPHRRAHSWSSTTELGAAMLKLPNGLRRIPLEVPGG